MARSGCACRRTVEALVVQRDQPVQPNLLVFAQHALDQERGLRGTMGRGSRSQSTNLGWQTAQGRPRWQAGVLPLTAKYAVVHPS